MIDSNPKPSSGWVWCYRVPLLPDPEWGDGEWILNTRTLKCASGASNIYFNQLILINYMNLQFTNKKDIVIVISDRLCKAWPFLKFLFVFFVVFVTYHWSHIIIFALDIWWTSGKSSDFIDIFLSASIYKMQIICLNRKWKGKFLDLDISAN